MAGGGYDAPVPSVNSYRDLIVWQKAMDLATRTLVLAHELRHPRFFAIADQLRRAALSVPANFAEGYGRRSRAEYRRFGAIANGSLRELETLLLLLERVDPNQGPSIAPLLATADEVCRMLTALDRSLRLPPPG